MCGFTKHHGKEGIKFKDGTFISFDDFSFDNLTEQQRKEIDEMHIYNELAIRKRLHEHGNILQRIVNRLDLLDERIGNIADGDFVVSVINKKLEKMAKMAKSVAVILGALSSIGYLVYIILEKAK